MKSFLYFSVLSECHVQKEKWRCMYSTANHCWLRVGDGGSLRNSCLRGTICVSSLWHVIWSGDPAPPMASRTQIGAENGKRWGERERTVGHYVEGDKFQPRSASLPRLKAYNHGFQFLSTCREPDTVSICSYYQDPAREASWSLANEITDAQRG